MFENEWIAFLVDLAVNSATYFGYISMALGSLYTFFLVVPGKYPDVWIDAAKQFTDKYSKK